MLSPATRQAEDMNLWPVTGHTDIFIIDDIGFDCNSKTKIPVSRKWLVYWVLRDCKYFHNIESCSMCTA